MFPIPIPNTNWLTNKKVNENLESMIFANKNPIKDNIFNNIPKIKMYLVFLFDFLKKMKFEEKIAPITKAKNNTPYSSADKLKHFGVINILPNDGINVHDIPSINVQK